MTATIIQFKPKARAEPPKGDGVAPAIVPLKEWDNNKKMTDEAIRGVLEIKDLVQLQVTFSTRCVHCGANWTLNGVSPTGNNGILVANYGHPVNDCVCYGAGGLAFAKSIEDLKAEILKSIKRSTKACLISLICATRSCPHFTEDSFNGCAVYEHGKNLLELCPDFVDTPV